VAVFASPTYEMIAYRCRLRFDGGMTPRFLTILTGRNLPRIIGQSREKRRLPTLPALLSRRESCWANRTPDTRQAEQ
jgi:hypothetical protein